MPSANCLHTPPRRPGKPPSLQRISGKVERVAAAGGRAGDLGPELLPFRSCFKQLAPSTHRNLYRSQRCRSGGGGGGRSRSSARRPRAFQQTAWLQLLRFHTPPARRPLRLQLHGSCMPRRVLPPRTATLSLAAVQERRWWRRPITQLGEASSGLSANCLAAAASPPHTTSTSTSLPAASRYLHA